MPNEPAALSSERSRATDPRLVELLLGQAAINGQTVSEMCDQLCITLGFFEQLRAGIRRTEDISPDLAQAAADYMNLPVGLVIAAGRWRK